jgi:hypothetical protein
MSSNRAAFVEYFISSPDGVSRPPGIPPKLTVPLDLNIGKDPYRLKVSSEMDEAELGLRPPDGVQELPQMVFRNGAFRESSVQLLFQS